MLKALTSYIVLLTMILSVTAVASLAYGPSGQLAGGKKEVCRISSGHKKCHHKSCPMNSEVKGHHHEASHPAHECRTHIKCAEEKNGAFVSFVPGETIYIFSRKEAFITPPSTIDFSDYLLPSHTEISFRIDTPPKI